MQLLRNHDGVEEPLMVFQLAQKFSFVVWLVVTLAYSRLHDRRIAFYCVISQHMPPSGTNSDPLRAVQGMPTVT
jgi:hypothetical protein